MIYFAFFLMGFATVTLVLRLRLVAAARKMVSQDALPRSVFSDMWGWALLEWVLALGAVLLLGRGTVSIAVVTIYLFYSFFILRDKQLTFLKLVRDKAKEEVKEQ